MARSRSPSRLRDRPNRIGSGWNFPRAAPLSDTGNANSKGNTMSRSGPMRQLPQALPLLAGAGAGAVLAGFCALLLDANLSDGVEVATIVPSLLNCAAVGSLVARCIAH